MRVTIRSDSVEIEGYVNAVGRDSRRMTDEHGNAFVEQIQPGTFGRALQTAKSPIPALLDHKTDRVLSDTDSGLELEEDNIGLYARFVCTDAEVIEKARAEKLVGWSFGFKTLDSRETYDYDAHIERSIITELDLKEVSVIDDNRTPVYSGTSIHTRADEGEESIYIRAMDCKVSYLTESANEPAPEQRVKDTETNKPAIDYSKYDDTIKRLRR